MSLLEEVEKLRNAPVPEVRVAVAEKVTHFFDNSTFDKFESKLACEILRLLARDVEIRVRKTLSDNLKSNGSIPRDIALTLANDVMEVSLPVLESSPLLTDEDLVEIIKSAEEVAKLEVIANRDNVSESVSGALVSRHQNKVTSTLLSNKGAAISEHDFIEIINQSASESSIVEKMVFRGDLPISVVARVMQVASDAMKKELKSRYDVDGNKIDEVVEESLEQSTLGLLNQSDSTLQAGAQTGVSSQQEVQSTLAANQMEADAASEEDPVPSLSKMVDPQLMKKTKELVAYLQRSEKLTPSIVLRALCEGNLPFFEVGMSRLAGIPVLNAHMLVWTTNPEAFKSLYKRAHMPMGTLDAIELILLFMKQEAMTNINLNSAKQQIRQRVVERILTGGYSDSVPLMPYFLTLINSKMSTKDFLG